MPAKSIHLLSGISGRVSTWAKGSVSMIVRLHYEGGKTEDHPLKNGVEFADYNQRAMFRAPSSRSPSRKHAISPCIQN